MRAPFQRSISLMACAIFACSRELISQPAKPKPTAEEFIPDKVDKKHVEPVLAFELIPPYVPNHNYDFSFDTPTRYAKRRWSDSTFPNPQRHIRSAGRKPKTKLRRR